MLITFSGTDGAGKSTQIQLLQLSFQQSGKKVICLWARGGYTPGFELLKRIIRSLFKSRLAKPGSNNLRTQQLSNPLLAKTWLFIATLDLIIYWCLYIRVLQLFSIVVICDRYTKDTLLDFRHNFPDIPFERSFFWRLLLRIIPNPDISFLLWVPVSESLRRSALKNEPFPDDKETLDWRLNAYLTNSLFPVNQYFILDCTLSVDTLASYIHDKVHQAFPLLFTNAS